METYEALQCEKCGSPITTIMKNGNVKCDYCGLIYTKCGTRYTPCISQALQSPVVKANESLYDYEQSKTVPFLNASLEIINNSIDPKGDFERIKSLHGNQLLLIEEEVEPLCINNNKKKPYKFLHPFDSQLLLSSSKDIDEYHKDFRDQLCEEFQKRITDGELIVLRNAQIEPFYRNLGSYSHKHLSYDNPFDYSNIFGSDISGFSSQSLYEEFDGIKIKAYINETIKELYIQGIKNAEWCQKNIANKETLSKFRKYYGITNTLYYNSGFSFVLGRTLITRNPYWITLNKPFSQEDFKDALLYFNDPDSEKKNAIKKMFNSCNRYEFSNIIYCSSSYRNRSLSENLFLGKAGDEILGYTIEFDDLYDSVFIEIKYGSKYYQRIQRIPLGSIDQAFIQLAQYSNRCSKCGGKFKLFKNICSKCGAEKDY